MSNLVPEPMTHADLAAFLRWAADEVESHDSWEGNIEWHIPDDDSARHDCDVTAIVRIGNSMGQGGVRMIGAVP